MGNPRKYMVIAVLVGGLTYDSAAHAYLDPGTGSILLQGLLAAIAGASVTLGLYWGKIKSFFNRGKTSSEQSDEDNTLQREKAEDGS